MNCIDCFTLIAYELAVIAIKYVYKLMNSKYQLMTVARWIISTYGSSCNHTHQRFLKYIYHPMLWELTAVCMLQWW